MEKMSVNSNDREKALAALPEGLDELHNTFIRNVSHELRTPLAVLKGYAELLHDGDLGDLAPEQRQAMFVIVNRAEEMHKIVARVGALMAVQSNATVAEPITLSAIVAQMLEAQRAKAAEAGITLAADLASDVPQVLGDAEQLREAIDCLVENAIKFTPNGGRIDIQVGATPECVNFTVADSGIGMDREELEQLFQPFHQLDGSITRRYGGMGLGLTLVQKVVEVHGGKIEVQSEIGAGSTFTVKLPTIASEEGLEENATPEVRARRILIVDDEEFVVFTLKEGLEKLPNCEVAITMNGQEALALFEAEPFDLVITDYKMPDMNGVELATRVREMRPKTGIIMVTAYSNDLLREPSATASIQRVLNKPVRLSEIRSAALETLGDDAEAA